MAGDVPAADPAVSVQHSGCRARTLTHRPAPAMTGGQGVNVTCRPAELLPVGAKVGQGGSPDQDVGLRPAPPPRRQGGARP